MALAAALPGSHVACSDDSSTALASPQDAGVMDEPLPEPVETGPDASSCFSTSSDALGPFYQPGSPERVIIAPSTEPGERVLIRGRVLAADCRTPVAGAVIEIWHADASGQYHSAEESWRLRGHIKSDQDGWYAFESIWPGNYSGRPRHYHYRVTAPGSQPLVTQLYFKGDPYLGENDSCQLPTCDSADPARIIELVSDQSQPERREGRFDIVLAH